MPLEHEGVREDAVMPLGRSPRRCIALAAGGTSGHIYPALAVAAALRARNQGYEPLFVGTAHGLESRIIPAHGEQLHIVTGLPFQRVGIGGKLLAVGAAAAGLVEARRLFSSMGVCGVIGFGGYASVGAVFAARSLGIATAILESNEKMGQGNRLLRRYVDRIYLGHAAASDSSVQMREKVVGVPIRTELAELRRRQRRPPAGRTARVLVLSDASQSSFLNRSVPSLLSTVTRKGIALSVVHQSGPAHIEETALRYADSGVDAQVVPYIGDMAEAYSHADLAICRGGASTLAELSAAGLPALIVSLPQAAEDHQAANAAALEARGAALAASEAGWNEEAIADRLVSLLDNRDEWTRCSEAMSLYRSEDAAGALAEDLLEMVGARMKHSEEAPQASVLHRPVRYRR